MLKKTRFGFDKVSTYMNCPETAEFTMDGPQLKKTGKLLIKYFITLILRKYLRSFQRSSLVKRQKNVGKGKTRVSSY